MRYDTFTPDDEKLFVKLTEEKGAVATFIYSSKILASGKISKYGNGLRTEAFGGRIFVPVSFFESHFNVKTVLKDSETVLTLNGASVSLSHSDDTVKEREGNVYVTLVETARELGLFAHAFFNGRLGVVAPRGEVIDYLKANKSVADAGAYAVFGEYDVTGFTKSDYKAVKDKMRLRLAGSPELNDMSNPYIAEKIRTVSEECRNALESLNTGDDPIILWGTEPPRESVDLSRQYRPIVRLAKGYATYGSDFYHDEELLRKIIFCMDWMYENMYGEAEIAGTGWRDVHLFNWWEWYIDAPECITTVIFLIEDHLTYEDKKRYLKCFEWVKTFMRTDKNCATSRISVCTKVGLVFEDAEYLRKEHDDFDQLLTLHPDGIEGPHVDYLCFTHGFPHNTSYGVGQLDRVLAIGSLLSGTPFDFETPERYNQFMFAKYMFEASMYNGQGFLMFTGRSVAASELGRGQSIICNILPMIGVFGEDEDKYLKKFIKRSSVSPKLREMVSANCTIYNLAVYDSIINDDTIPYDNDYECAHVWYTGDRMAQHRNGYAVAVATSSEREMSYESINSANQTGWYTGDGAMYLYTAYDDGQYDGVNFIYKNDNIAYRYPGTTEDMQPRVARSILNGYAWRNPTLFSGGAVLDGKYITCGFDFTAMHFDGPDLNIVDTGYGAGQAPHHNDLVARKSWFMFDDEVVCLGAGITSTTGSPVNTVVEHRRVVKEDKFSQFVMTEQKTALKKTPYEKRFQDLKWFLMEGHAGFVFPEGGNVYLGRYNCESANGQPFLELRLEHGACPDNAKYSYVVIPYATEEKLNKYYEDPDVQIISNTRSIAAVKEKRIGVMGFMFYEPGECEGVSVDKPCIITASKDQDTFCFAVSDPTQKLTEINITLDFASEPLFLDEGVTACSCVEKTKIKINCDGSLGRPINVKLKI